MAEKFKIRCTPDCPYDDCIIITTIPPMMGGQPSPGGEGDQRDSNNTNSNSAHQSGSGSSSGTKSQSKSGSDQEQQSERGDSTQGSTQGNSQSSEGHAGGNNDQHQRDSGDHSGSSGRSDQQESGTGKDKSNSDGSSEQKESGDDKDTKGNASEDKPQDKSEDKSGTGEDDKKSEQEESKSESGKSEESGTGGKSPQAIEWQRPEQPEKEVEQYEPIFRYDLPWGHGAADDLAKEPPNPGKPKKGKKTLTDAVFRARLKNIMVDNAFDRHVRGRKRGKLDMRSLYKVPMKAENVFTLKEARKNKRYNVLLLIDESGSMGGQGKALHAAKCAVFLAQSFEGINVNVAIVGFNHYITTRKTFTGVADYKKIHDQIASMNNGHGAGDNNDWDALNKAYDMFKTAPEGQNILIMLSDGHPASGSRPQFVDVNGKLEKPPKGTGHLNAYQRDESHHIHALVRANEHRAKSVGIGIMEGGWQIPNHDVIRNVEQLKPLIIEKLSKEIKRG